MGKITEELRNANQFLFFEKGKVPASASIDAYGYLLKHYYSSSVKYYISLITQSGYMNQPSKDTTIRHNHMHQHVRRPSNCQPNRL
jgi:hypothetical protein